MMLFGGLKMGSSIVSTGTTVGQCLLFGDPTRESGTLYNVEVIPKK